MPDTAAFDEGVLPKAAVTWSDRNRLHDYAAIGQKLFVQRIVIYSAAMLLTGFYLDWATAVYFYAAIWLCEAFDALSLRSVLKRAALSPGEFRVEITRIYVVTFLGALTIALFSISIASLQGTDSGHFFPLFILVSASIFAAMNNHHFLKVLGLRLVIYVIAILYIPIRDVWIERPPLSSEIWMNLFTVLFVLGFIVELARNFLVGYSAQLEGRQALEAEHKRTLAAYEAKTRFLATVSHELRTPLTSIKGALDMINSGLVGEPPDKMKRLLDMAGRNSDRLADLVGDLLFLQSSDAGRLNLNIERVDLAVPARDAVEQTLPYAQRLGITIEIQAASGRFWINADKKRIEQVIANLLSNAAKFSRKGDNVVVSIDSTNAHVQLYVQDQGIGIPAGTGAKIFEEFFQIDAQDDRQFEGTGLGLSVSKRIVEAHGGTITYESEVGLGTTFCVELDAADLPADPPADPPA
ncbi:sensor histidine kinase [Pseudosulfitobacter koreensis]|uniref:histidine kinase n=1 Tax=Pseudosulfitobacter koreensis TaxID=2968472 RepID=A0ABT1Z3C7_9RHOB|nr:HAMP domain-containing sensor histidine kinase [Pseudosulfitobacter koreense]MCR8827652.1 HAMP domain-containing histidine kinase [Pseudosulfitobacter koreense]